MPKNPFVNCKSRKRRKARAPISKPKEKLFCPRTMVRYDNSPSDYGTIWVCKMCLVCMLSEDAVKKHLTNCNALSKKDKPAPATKKNEDIHYICETCKKIFSRRVTLKKHLEEHEKSSSSNDSELSDYDADPFNVENINDNDDESEPESEDDIIDDLN
ncbi:uncharacterized protein LOC112602761 [Melanaphis sacchari]|uniref:uncharacterized protein LOC112602761 n=1 Tax=Melanaphis sacchari TaxID=742174 RepID=UPI000DC14B7C|nr:uncharacterized protein LOC112602761 [Melanaphis sacchari]XP_025206804.1 uncharacterized protein LOC112602761 [Melanaphis sacchari]XP_025206805.1 uncharacterized protein LOC112602761 [Melanaphis sacchari]